LPPIDIFRHFVMYMPRLLWLSRTAKAGAHIEIENRKVIVIVSTDTEFDPPPDDGTWWKRPTKGLLDGLPRFLDVCDGFNIPATFFCEGKLVEELPDLFKELGQNHEIGSHSYNHEWLGTKPPPRWIQCRSDFAVLTAEAKMKILKRGLEAIERAIGRKPFSFKAPFNSVDHPTTLAILNHLGFKADSSLPCYDNESFSHPLRPSPTRHTSELSLWNEGQMNLLEVPFSIRPRPLFLHPFDTREEIMDTVVKGMKLAMESVALQCKIDALAGRDISLVHVTSHPWEFSTLRPWGGDGTVNAKRLKAYLETLTSTYNTKFCTVHEFSTLWEAAYCDLHGSKANRSQEAGT
jgi:peptidoglycan/xylan/chitin deacetylase (PgdA/CDA1 family)